MGSKNTKLAHLLLSKGLSSRDVIESTGINKAHVSLIKNGYQNMTIQTLKKLCSYLNCSPNDILDWEEWLKKESPGRCS